MFEEKISSNEELSSVKRRSEPEVVVFESRRKKKEHPGTEARKHSPLALQKDSNCLVLDMKKVRHEVYKFGISGFTKEKLEDARMALAIKLGAKPPKRAYKNYKELIEERKQQRLKEKEEGEINRKMGINMVRPKRRKTRNRNDVRNFKCQIGKYREGIQYVSKKDIAEIKKKR